MRWSLALLLFLAACASAPEPTTTAPEVESVLIDRTVGTIPWSGPRADVRLDVDKDDDEGWNVHAIVDGMRIAPEHAATEHVPGEGYLRLSVDDVFIARMYGEWYHLQGHELAEHEVRVVLASNTHQEYVIDGVPIDDQVVIHAR